jgi:hypothetical protein
VVGALGLDLLAGEGPPEARRRGRSGVASGGDVVGRVSHEERAAGRLAEEGKGGVDRLRGGLAGLEVIGGDEHVEEVVEAAQGEPLARPCLFFDVTIPRREPRALSARTVSTAPG